MTDDRTMTQFSADAYGHDTGTIGDLDSLWALPETDVTPSGTQFGYWQDVNNATQMSEEPSPTAPIAPAAQTTTTPPSELLAADRPLAWSTETWAPADTWTAVTPNPFDTNPLDTNPFETNQFQTNPLAAHPLETNPFDTLTLHNGDHTGAVVSEGRAATEVWGAAGGTTAPVSTIGPNSTTILSTVNPFPSTPAVAPELPSSEVLMAVSAARSQNRNEDSASSLNDSDDHTGFKPERNRPSLPLLIGGMVVAALISLTAFTVLGSSTTSFPSPTLLTNSNPGTFPSSTLATATTAPVPPVAGDSDPIFDEPASTEVVTDVAPADSAGSAADAPTDTPAEVVFGEAADPTAEAPAAAPGAASPVDDPTTVLIVPDGAPLPTP